MYNVPWMSSLIWSLFDIVHACTNWTSRYPEKICGCFIATTLKSGNKPTMVSLIIVVKIATCYSTGMHLITRLVSRALSRTPFGKGLRRETITRSSLLKGRVFSFKVGHCFIMNNSTLQLTVGRTLQCIRLLVGHIHAWLGFAIIIPASTKVCRYRSKGLTFCILSMRAMTVTHALVLWPRLRWMS